MRNATVPSTPNIQVLERMFTLIDVLASREDAISLKEISERTGLHPSTAHRILNDLAVAYNVPTTVASPLVAIVNANTGVVLVPV